MPPPIPETVEGGLGAAPAASEPAPSTAADSLAASVAWFTVVVDRVTEAAADKVADVADVVKALIGAEGASKAVKDLIERVGELVSALLLGGNGASGPVEGLIGQVGDAVGELAHALGGVLGGLLGVGGDGAPADPASDYYYHLAAQPLAAFYYDYEQATAELIEWSAAAAGEMTRAVGGALDNGSGSGAAAPNQEAGAGGGVPATPPPAPPLVPVAPPVAPVGYSFSLLGAPGSAADAFQLLFAILMVFSVALLQGGRLSWLRREAHGPPTALVLAIERPG
jgi:hypothetical protein